MGRGTVFILCALDQGCFIFKMCWNSRVFVCLFSKVPSGAQKLLPTSFLNFIISLPFIGFRDVCIDTKIMDHKQSHNSNNSNIVPVLHKLLCEC